MKDKNVRNRVIIAVIIGIVAATLLIGGGVFVVKKNTYTATYREGASVYTIRKTFGKIEVIAEDEVECIKAPCPKVKRRVSLDFSKENMAKVDEFVTKIFDGIDGNATVIFAERLGEDDVRILKSMIKGDETLMSKNISANEKYLITTNMQYLTMQNDGGSHYNTYYEIDLTNGNVTKYEDRYVGFVGYEYQGAVVFSKVVNNKMRNELREVIGEALTADEATKGKYGPYMIEMSGSEPVKVYDEEMIKKLREVLDRVDEV